MYFIFAREKIKLAAWLECKLSLLFLEKISARKDQPELEFDQFVLKAYNKGNEKFVYAEVRKHGHMRLYIISL